MCESVYNNSDTQAELHINSDSHTQSHIPTDTPRISMSYMILRGPQIVPKNAFQPCKILFQIRSDESMHPIPAFQTILSPL